MMMVKSSAQMVTHLQKWATYAFFEAWLMVVKDWVLSHTHTTCDNLGPAAIHTVARLTMSPDICSWLEICRVLGMI